MAGKPKNHITDKVCSCEYCQMIDVIFGDPLLNKWEKEFIDSVSQQGWQRDYSLKQKVVIKKIFTTQRKRYLTKC